MTSIEELSSEMILALLLSLHVLIGVVGAIVAYYKGRSLKQWLLIGIACGTPALLVALVMKRETTA
ncbi:hypothetical protein ACQ4M4_19600 [Leptolyngbya sp. AN02str]|uniref:hypothetical protein n=1 Tax=Leptolyngbya sp. AN02str TaxID=3423363 RepID=UPI003D31974E